MSIFARKSRRGPLGSGFISVGRGVAGGGCRGFRASRFRRDPADGRELNAAGLLSCSGLAARSTSLAEADAAHRRTPNLSWADERISTPLRR